LSPNLIGGALLALTLAFSSTGASARSVALVHTDFDYYQPVQSKLLGTGLFDQVDSFDVHYSLPPLAQLDAYDAVLAWTNSPLVYPYSITPTALGNLLADYVDSGKGLLLASASFSSPWAIGGRIMTEGYSPLVDVGLNGLNSGHLTPVLPADPIFAGVDFDSLRYFNNENMAHAAPDKDALLLATDGAGTNMIARSHTGQVLAYNFMPRFDDDLQQFHDNGGVLQLLANGLVSVSDLPAEQAPNDERALGNIPVGSAPEPGSAALLFTGAVGLLARSGKRRGPLPG
jgi:hypothetical protein